MSMPSSKTSFVIVGNDPGASKLEKAKKHNLKTLDEDGLLDLVRSRSKNVAAPAKKQESRPMEIDSLPLTSASSSFVPAPIPAAPAADKGPAPSPMQKKR